MFVKDLFKLDGELPFINIDTCRDTELYIDPIMLKAFEGPFDKICLRKLESFRNKVLDSIDSDSTSKTESLISGYFHEDNATHLGMAKENSPGKAISEGKEEVLLDIFLTNKAIREGIVPEVVDMMLFAEGIGPDNISDMITNVLRKELSDYTEHQCKRLNIPTEKVNAGYFRDIDSESWKELVTNLPLDENGKHILFVPKNIVSDYTKYTGWRYFNLVVLPSVKSGKDIKKKILIEMLPRSVNFITSETLKSPYLLDKFKAMVYAEYKEMVRNYGTSDAIFCIDLGIGKIRLRTKSYKEALIKQRQIKK